MVMTRAKNRRWEEVEKDSIELSVLTRHFELCNLTEGKSPKTIDWYNQALAKFHHFLMESEKSTILGDLSEVEIREFTLYLQGRRRIFPRWRIGCWHVGNWDDWIYRRIFHT